MTHRYKKLVSISIRDLKRTNNFETFIKLSLEQIYSKTGKQVVIFCCFYQIKIFPWKMFYRKIEYFIKVTNETNLGKLLFAAKCPLTIFGAKFFKTFQQMFFSFIENMSREIFKSSSNLFTLFAEEENREWRNLIFFWQKNCFSFEEVDSFDRR